MIEKIVELTLVNLNHHLLHKLIRTLNLIDNIKNMIHLRICNRYLIALNAIKSKFQEFTTVDSAIPAFCEWIIIVHGLEIVLDNITTNSSFCSLSMLQSAALTFHLPWEFHTFQIQTNLPIFLL